MADLVKLQQPAEVVVNGHSIAELTDGVVVIDALLDAHRFLFPL